MCVYVKMREAYFDQMLDHLVSTPSPPHLQAPRLHVSSLVRLGTVVEALGRQTFTIF